MKNYDNQNCEIFIIYFFMMYFLIDSVNYFLFYLLNTDLDIQ